MKGEPGSAKGPVDLSPGERRSGACPNATRGGKLLKLRNDIAHGEFLLIDVDGFDQLSTEILDLIRQFKTALQNAVVQKSYLRAPPGAAAPAN